MGNIELDILNEYIRRLGEADVMDQQSVDELQVLLAAEKLPRAEDICKVYVPHQKDELR